VLGLPLVHARLQPLIVGVRAFLSDVSSFCENAVFARVPPFWKGWGEPPSLDGRGCGLPRHDPAERARPGPGTAPGPGGVGLPTVLDAGGLNLAQVAPSQRVTRSRGSCSVLMKVLSAVPQGTARANPSAR